MIKPTHLLVLGLLGSALATVIVQHALKSDGSAAARPVTERTDPSDRTAPKLGRAFLGNSDETADTGDVTMPGRTGWVRPATRPVNGVGRLNNQQSSPSAFHDTGAGSDTGAGTPAATMAGLALPRWGGVAGGGGSAGGVDPTSTTTQPIGAPAAEVGCKHELGVQLQGVTAHVDFVGKLLDGQERAGQNFSGAQLSDLKILVQWQSLFQNHLQRLDLIAPDGSLYQSLSRPLTVRDADAPVETLLPVNGTWITRYGLYGAWCVEAFLDQQEQPITSSRLVIASPR